MSGQGDAGAEQRVSIGSAGICHRFEGRPWGNCGRLERGDADEGRAPKFDLVDDGDALDGSRLITEGDRHTSRRGRLAGREKKRAGSGRAAS